MASPSGNNSLMHVKTEHLSGAVVIAISGDIDLAGSPTLRQEVRKAASEKPERLIINLAEVGYMDSSGVATLVEAMQLTRRGNSKLVLCGLQTRVRSVFEIARLDSIFTIVANLDDALR